MHLLRKVQRKRGVTLQELPIIHMKTKKDPRHQSRVIAIQRLFEHLFRNEENESNWSAEGLLHTDETLKHDAELVEKLESGVSDNLEEIDQIIEKYATERPIDQMSKIDHQILRIAVYEGFVGKITPPKVTIDEAVELGREFAGETSAKFINGVLGKLFETQAADEHSK